MALIQSPGPGLARRPDTAPARKPDTPSTEAACYLLESNQTPLFLFGKGGGRGLICSLIPWVPLRADQHDIIWMVCLGVAARLASTYFRMSDSKLEAF